ncbi:MAG: Uma2 family endonuclease [Planctomycetota bacterium]
MSVSTQERYLAGTICLPIVVQLQPVVSLSDEQLFDVCQVNRDLRIERNEYGELIIMPPTGGDTGDRNSEINMQLRTWAKRDGTGKAFDSSTGFRLPNGAMRSPDAAWLLLSRWNVLTAEQRKKFVPLCPDFVVELRSPTDSLNAVQEKMQEYLANGAAMGLLVDPEQKRVHVYWQDREVQILENQKSVACDPVLPGFALELREIW